MTDPISDFITRIRNGYLAHRKLVSVPYSTIKGKLAKILLEEGYLQKIEIKGKQPQEKQLILELKYRKRESVITQIERVSKPSLRIYFQAKDLKPLRGGFGMRILSTPKGLMIDKQARKQNLGGEVICQLW